MTLIQLVIIAVVQGITEFLPISSSGHLVLIPYVTGWTDQGLLVDVAVHVGSLGAVIVYFWRDVWDLVVGAWHALLFRPDRGSRLLGLMIVATIPAIVAGLALKLIAPDLFRSVAIIAWTMLLGGILLYVADRFGLRINKMDHITLRSAWLIGLAQMLALVPGTSRSGITMTAARALGFERDEAARFSMLLSIPVIVAAGALAGLDLVAQGDSLLTSAAVTAAALAFVSALLAIALLMRWLRHASFTPLVVYRVALGLVLLWFVYG